MERSHNILKAFAAGAFAYASYGLAVPAILEAEEVYVCCGTNDDCMPSVTGWLCWDFGVDCQDTDSHLFDGHYFCAGS